MSNCVEYAGYKDKDGYGQQWDPATYRQRGAHRLAYEREHSVRLASTDIVRHTCDNPGCVNPAHLVIGSQRENMQDMVKRGRLGDRLGERNNQAVLTDEQVAQVRAAYTGRHCELTKLGKQFGVSRVTISNIVTGRYR